MPLTELKVRNATPREKPYKLADGAGLYLFVHNHGGRYWRYDYRHDGKRKTASFGVYPAVSLKDARSKLENFRTNLDAPPVEAVETMRFADVVSDWMTRKLRPESAPATITKTEWLLTFVDSLNERDMANITSQDVLKLLRRVEAQGRHESARRLRSVLSRIFRYAVGNGWAERDVTADLIGLLTAPKVKHRAAPLRPDEIGRLMRAMKDYSGYLAVGVAMRFGALTFVRPYELRFAVWDEFDLDGAMWRIPGDRMKMGRDHLVPLSRQAIAQLRRLQEFYEPRGFLFPSLRSDSRPISENTINAALRNLGFSTEEATHHGFRRMASTTLNEKGWNRDWVERQLAHVPGDVRGVYNAAEYLDGRIKMMQAWADTLDEFAGDVEDLIG